VDKSGGMGDLSMRRADFVDKWGQKGDLSTRKAEFVDKSGGNGGFVHEMGRFCGREEVRRHHRRTSRPAVTSGGLLSSYGSSKQPRSLPGLSGRARNVRHSRPTATVSSSIKGTFEDELEEMG